VLDQRGVGRLAIRKLDDPLLAALVEERLGPRAAHRGAGRHESSEFGRNRLVGLHFADELVDLVGLLQRRQWSEAPRQVPIGGSRDSEGSETIIPGEVQILEQREASRFIDEPDDTLAPTIGTRIVDRANRSIPLERQKLLIDERQIFAELEPVLAPMREIAQRNALIGAHQVELAHRNGSCRLEQRPEVEPIGDLVAGRACGRVCGRSAHAPAFCGRRRASRARAEAAERTARRASAWRTSPSSAPRSSAGAARPGNPLTLPTNQSAVA